MDSSSSPSLPGVSCDATQTLVFDINIWQLGRGSAATAKAISAWLTLLASYKCDTAIRLTHSGAGSLSGLVDVGVHWDAPVEELVHRVEAHLSNLTHNTAKMMPTSSASSVDGLCTATDHITPNFDMSSSSSSDGIATPDHSVPSVDESKPNRPGKSSSSSSGNNTTYNSGVSTPAESLDSSQPSLLSLAHLCTQDFSLAIAEAGEPQIVEIHCSVGAGNIRAFTHMPIEVAAHSGLLSQISRHYEYIVREIALGDNALQPLIDLKAISGLHLSQIWEWNANVPKGRHDVCIHELFMERAQRHPDLPAIDAHDGKMTYRQLDEASTCLAGVILSRGILPGSIIMVFIEKSMWVPVAQLAIMKSGCVSTVLDVSLPDGRHQQIAELVQPAAILSSSVCSETIQRLQPSCVHLTISHDSLHSWASDSTVLPKVSPSSWLYIVFTSGSTGTPKGAIISHENYASAVATQQTVLDVVEYDRVFDFASYAFDASWCNVIHALTVGGCLCIPSDEERKEDVAAALRKYQVNYAVMTPSVAWFPASQLPDSLRTIHFGGEALKASMVRELSARITVINAYGPAECSTVSTAIVGDPSDDEDPTIGQGLGACTWVVKLDGTDLVPIGEIGELWVEGPIVGQGYLGEPQKTADAFVESPPWLVRGCRGSPSGSAGHHPGRRGRMYKTGDLVRYRDDGNLEFVGRKDSQVKVRGQRVELGEIEHNIQRALTEEARQRNVQTVAHVIKPEGTDATTLVCFLFLSASSGVSGDEAEVILNQALVGTESRLAEMVPPYMVPSAFFPIQNVPMTPTGKVDRKRLLQDGPTLYKELQKMRTLPCAQEQEQELSATELAIREVWSDVLNIPPQGLDLDAAFTRLGGDSISAMQVVSRCRAQNMAVRVADILKLQTIRRISETVRLVRAKVDRADADADADATMDEGGQAWPLTPIQQIFFDNNPQGMNYYTLSFIVKLTRHASLAQLASALLILTNRHGMLRTRFRKTAAVDGQGSQWEQYLAAPGPEAFAVTERDYSSRVAMQAVVDQRQDALDLVTGPVFAVDVFNAPGEPQTLLMSAHHAIMDLVSWRVIWHELSQLLQGATSLPRPIMSFATWCRLQRQEAMVLDPSTVLPFQVVRPDFGYWDASPAELLFKHSALDISTVPAAETELLLGASNECFGTEILDILVGTLAHCFGQIFSDRTIPAIFVEGHGREPVDGMDDADLADIVGWFTSLYPIQLPSGEPSGQEEDGCKSVLDMIKRAKDVRRSVPGKGRPYFASRFHSEAGARAFRDHRYPEIIFNYRGSFQQLEDERSLFKYEDRHHRNVTVPGDGPDYQRPSLIDMNLVIQDGKLQVWTRYHKSTHKHARVLQWIKHYAQTLATVSHELCKSPAQRTLSDVPLLDISYKGLDLLIAGQLAEANIAPGDIKDMYGCTPMQEGVLISAVAGTASYRTVTIWKAVQGTSGVCASTLAEAWTAVTRAHPVLCTIFTTNPDDGRFVQVVLREANDVAVCRPSSSEAPVDYLTRMQGPVAASSQPQCFFTVCVGDNQEVACRLDISHALIDAASLPILTRDLEKAYAGQALGVSTVYSAYVDHVRRASSSARLLYWQSYLADAMPCILPGDVDSIPVTARSTQGSRHAWLDIRPDVASPVAEACRLMGLTRSAFLHIAWSLVLSYFTGMREVCFGYLSSGRDAPIDGIQDIVGPLIAMLLARVDLEQPLTSVIDQTNLYNINHLEHEHVSLAELQHAVAAKKLFNTNITVREARLPPPPSADRIQFIEISEEDPHEVGYFFSNGIKMGGY